MSVSTPSLAQVPPAVAAPVPAGRADENAVRQAADAFGISIGRETIGIYTSGSVRGFSPLSAGNARIAGLYFDQVTPPNSRIRRSTSIRIGLSAQGYLFPAPTGVVDYALRAPGDEPLLSATAGYNSYGDKSLEIDGEWPLIDGKLSLGVGAAVYDHVFHNDTTSFQHVEGVTFRWRPAPGVELLPFWGRSYIKDDEIGPGFSTSGPFLPPHIQRGVYYGPQWADYSGPAETFGLLGSARSGPWLFEAGVFHGMVGSTEDIFPFIDQITPDGDARYVAYSDPPYRRASLSGELRATREFTEGPRNHRVSLSVRGRERNDRTGGSAFLDFGPVRLGDPLDFPQPDITYDEYDRDRVRQLTAGAAYVGQWRGVGELSLGLSRSDYRKRFRRPEVAETRTEARPWLYNIGGALYAGRNLAFYAGHTRGLEETGLPPQNAINRNQALPATLTRQVDAGLRWNLPRGMKLVLGAFEVRKPYLSTDATGLFTQLGDTRNRGIEASLSGSPAPGLSVVLGYVKLDAEVVGEARRLGRTGKRPVGVPLGSLELNIDWRLPWHAPLSLDLRVGREERTASTVDNALFIPAQTLVDVGARYRLKLGRTDATLRVAVSNLFNAYGYEYRGPRTFEHTQRRLLTTYLAMDL